MTGIIAPMDVGHVLNERFVLQAQISSGGMGTVWRAVDGRADKPVAVKMLRDPNEGDNARFAHEVRVLSSLEHSHIVHYIGHGHTPNGAPYLVMEWLEGEDLGQRLARQGLTVEETVTLMKGVTSALGLAHSVGIVHRDIKPSNLFLVDGDVKAAKILDFGIARLSEASEALTITGSILGTPGYMAPEQARGERRVGPECDVFALGCVLFECLTGKPAFQGTHMAAILAKLLFEDGPDILEVRPTLPKALASIVSRMLARTPTDRFSHGAAVRAALESLEDLDAFSMDAVGQLIRNTPMALTISERRLVSIVAAMPKSEMDSDRSASVTLPEAFSPQRIAEMRKAEVSTGTKFELLANGMVVAMLVGAGNPADRAAAAARSALRMRTMLPGAVMTLMTGRSETKNRLPVGEMLDQAAAILASSSADIERGIRIDSTTQALLDTRFEVTDDNGRFYLQRELAIGEEPRTLLGKPSPFVGRERELRHLQEQIEEAFDEKAARSILVTGSAGMGKSRLRQELLRRLMGSVPEFTCVIGRADALGAGAAYASLASALRSSFAIEVGEPIETQRDKITNGIKPFLSGDDVPRVADFLGELAAVPFPDEHRPRLQAARQNAQIMATQIELAYVDLLRAMVRKKPILIVMEDLHWGDSASVKLLDAALRELHDQPLAILAFARPEVHEIFPKLWAGRSVVVARLNPLNRRAAENLVRHVLGESVSQEKLDVMFERSGGNAFYLEELIRAVAAGGGESLPDTVLGMVEARLAGLPAESRRLLRAASILGETFWVGGLRELLGDANAQLDDLLHELVTQELVVMKSTRRFVGEEEFGFRHALVREGAYAMLAEHDRTLGHQLAGEWLERAGEQDPVVLATHFELGGVRTKAAYWRTITAERILRGGDPPAALAMTDRALALQPEGETIAHLWAIRSEAAALTGGKDLALGIQAAKEALRSAQPGSRIYCQALYGGIITAFIGNQTDAAMFFTSQLLAIEPNPDHSSPLYGSFAAAITALLLFGQRELSALYLKRMQLLIETSSKDNPNALVWETIVLGHLEFWGQRNPWTSFQLYTRARELFEMLGDSINAHFTMLWQAMCTPVLGMFDEAEQYVRTLTRALPPGSTLIFVASHMMIANFVERGAPEPAIQGALAALEDKLSTNALNAVNMYLLLGDAYLMVGRIEEAEQALATSGAGESGVWINDMQARGLRARIFLARGQSAEAASLAEETVALCRKAGVYENVRHGATPLTRAEAHHAAGNIEMAHVAIREARDALLAIADTIDDPKVRRSFLDDVPVHARTFTLARVWLQERSA